ncbi:MAG: lytic transglycosylase domain-containing protein [Deltaproteobacteria bacterium]|nr:lytic transglycosylase domain-containing protein [Deltaproteobacteria bacterium]
MRFLCQKILLFGVLVLSIAYHPSPAFADIYTFTDENGVIHFSNVPTSKGKWRLKMKEGHFDSKKLSSGNYDRLIYSTAIRYGLDPLLVKAVIKAESDFDVLATSHKGAMGLMQLMPETANDMGIDDAYDPVQNIEGGVKYLKKLMGTYKTNLSLAIASYNAGEKAVQKYNGIPPYKETQEYVKRVLNYLRTYKNASNASFEIASK